MKELKDDTQIEVWNNHGWGVSYVTDKVVKTFSTPGMMRKVRFDELNEVMSFKGNRILFEQGALLIKDNEVRERLNLPALNEYILSLEEMKELLLTKDIKKIEDFMQYCSNMLLETFARVAIKLPVTDMNTIKLITEYSSVDVAMAIEENAEIVANQPNTNLPTEGKPRPKRIRKE